MISLHTKLQHSPGPNAFTLRLPVPSGLHVHEWRVRLQNYHDTDLCNFLEYGWPVGYKATTLPPSTLKNHGSAMAQPDLIQSYLDRECGLWRYLQSFLRQPSLHEFNNFTSSNCPQSFGKVARGRRPQLPLRFFGK